MGDLHNRVCGRCAAGIGFAPGTMWQPRRPPAHYAIACAGPPPGARPSTVTVDWAGRGTTRFIAGDAEAFLAPAGPAGPAVAHWQVTGQPDAPHLEVSGTAGTGARGLSFMAAMDYEWSPQEPDREAYGFRFRAGALGSENAAAGFDDLVGLLSAIDEG
jgi:hypothetical protein